MRSISELQSLADFWGIITGGGGHVGQAAAAALMELGANVVLWDRSKAALDIASANLAEYKNQLYTICCDLAIEEDIVKGVEQYREISSGRLNFLINNAAFVGTDNLTGWAVPFEQQSYDTFSKCIDVNLAAPFLLTKLCMPLFEITSTGCRSVVNISSIYGVVGPQMAMYEGTNLGNPAAYATSKAGLMQFTTWLSSVGAPNIRANNIVLGGIYRNQDEAFVEKYIQRVPLRRMATEEDIKGAVIFLCSGLSNYMTGQSIVLDGGWTAI
ncbi:SDR family oxidoreductase [Pseudoalteromonas piscicida]|uniref:SDR family oxidoreductase n=1 Tax=Pseudoalteromonas TaxID=53246 RepID=UPI00157257BD|nr:MULTISPECIES: SDR family oxidoreductase [Pseudoalteromonas]MCG7552490.1 SDR family oxidoreductase [Pseudoalteromonas sp. Of11M-6]NSY32145.1 SDR family NAD(P)-dependent oxidoreductase [Pseudoalteromonas sp. JC28]UDM62198.1 SDR family oxidoreductase [Pseudoalteromonas piscicida]